MAAESPPVLALDIGGTKLAVGVVTPVGDIRGYIVEPTRKDEGHRKVIRRLFALGQQAIRDAALGPVAAVGISSGGPLDPETGVVMAPLNLPDWIDVPLGDLARAEFGIPAVLVNDATAGMLAEHRYGAARGADIALYLTISTGVGGGAVVHGRLHRGSAGNGGEFGHVMVRPGGRRCTCGRLGCLEAYASGTSIAARARDALEEHGATSPLAALPVVGAEQVVAAARAGDALAVRLWTETTDVIGQAITDLVNTFEPEVVVLGGGVTRAGDLLIQPVRDIVARTGMPLAAASARIEFAELGESVCVVGAAARAFDYLEEYTLVR
ncbi:ROK family protein [Micromonospora sp. DT81.3]|uniref:ROK family protein n=1 Tax=Micromonospora sp. DT81.3 TaxID=3416523 RepID=UPI003CF761CB